MSLMQEESMWPALCIVNALNMCRCVCVYVSTYPVEKPFKSGLCIS